jgi:hypothetical protein
MQQSTSQNSDKIADKEKQNFSAQAKQNIATDAGETKM